MSAHNYSHLIFDKRGKIVKTYWRKESIFNIFFLGKLEVHKQKNEIRTISIIRHKISSKWIKDLNLKPEILKLLEENIGSSLESVGVGKNFLNRT